MKLSQEVYLPTARIFYFTLFVLYKIKGRMTEEPHLFVVILFQHFVPILFWVTTYFSLFTSHCLSQIIANSLIFREIYKNSIYYNFSAELLKKILRPD